MPRRKRADYSVKRIGLPYIEIVRRNGDTDLLYQGNRIMTMYSDGSVYVTDAQRSGAVIARRLNQIAEQQKTGLQFRADSEAGGIWVRTRTSNVMLPAVIAPDEMESGK